MPLKELEIKYTQRRQRPFKLSDGGGLYLLVQPNGSKLWRLKYRFEGKEKLLSFGKYPGVSLAAAREKRRTAKALLAGGIDPAGVAAVEDTEGSGAVPKAERPSRPEKFEEIARAWHENRESGLDPAHAARVLNRLKRDAFPDLGDRPIVEITAPEILEVPPGATGRMVREYLAMLEKHYARWIAESLGSNSYGYDSNGNLTADGGTTTYTYDPIDYQDQINLYAYVANDPVNKTDPTGLCGFPCKAAVDFGIEIAIQVATEGKVDLGAAAVETAKGMINPLKTVERARDLARAVRAANTARGRANEARRLAEIGAIRNTRAAPTSTGPRIRDGTKPDGTHVEVKDTKRVDATQQLRGLDEAAGKQGQRLEVHTGDNTSVSRNVNPDTMPNTDIVRCPKLGPRC